VWIVARTGAAADALQRRIGARTLEIFEVRGLAVRVLDSPRRPPAGLRTSP
jgi:hypothetical protein